MIFVVLATVLLVVVGQQQPYGYTHKQNPQILSYLRPQEPILLKLSVKHGEEVLFESEYELLYSLEQP